MEDQLLHLTARAVARANIENIDRLGAFNGKRLCLYHYGEPNVPPHIDCAIGIVDVNRKLVGQASIRQLKRRKLVSYGAKDDKVLMFIQRLHDSLVCLGDGRGAADGAAVRAHFSHHSREKVPPCCADLFATITEFNKDTYRQIMQLIAES